MNKYEQLAKSIRTVQWPTVTRPIYRRTCWIDPIWLCSAGSLQKSEGLEVKPGIFKGETCKNMEEHEPYCSKHLLRLYVGFNRDIVRRCNGLARFWGVQAPSRSLEHWSDRPRFWSQQRNFDIGMSENKLPQNVMIKWITLVHHLSINIAIWRVYRYTPLSVISLHITLWLCQNSYWKWPSRNSEFSHLKWWICP